MAWVRRTLGQVTRLASLVLAGYCPPASPQEAALPESQVKAAYILNFTRYANWPTTSANSQAPLVVCLLGLGADDIAQQLRSRMAGSRPLETRLLRRDDDPEACHALYISHSEGTRQGALLSRLRGSAVLTIGDSASFLADGGIINLMLVDGNIHFEINLAAAKRSGMSLNPRVLALADRVVGGSQR